MEKFCLSSTLFYLPPPHACLQTKVPARGVSRAAGGPAAQAAAVPRLPALQCLLHSLPSLHYEEKRKKNEEEKRIGPQKTFLPSGCALVRPRASPQPAFPQRHRPRGARRLELRRCRGVLWAETETRGDNEPLGRGDSLDNTTAFFHTFIGTTLLALNALLRHGGLRSSSVSPGSRQRPWQTLPPPRSLSAAPRVTAPPPFAMQGFSVPRWRHPRAAQAPPPAPAMLGGVRGGAQSGAAPAGRQQQ